MRALIRPSGSSSIDVTTMADTPVDFQMLVLLKLSAQALEL